MLLTAGLILSCSDPASSDKEETKETDPPDEPVVYSLTTDVSPPEGGEISPEDDEYEEDSEVEVTASPNDGWQFTGWEGDYKGDDNPVEVTMDEDKSITAIFEKKNYALVIETEGMGEVHEQIVTPKTDYEHGTTVELTAEPEDEWLFVGWDGDLSGNENPATITMDRERSVTAVFEEKYKETGEPYEAGNGITVTLESLEKEELDNPLHDLYTVRYTVENTTSDFVFEGLFKLYYHNEEDEERGTNPDAPTGFVDLRPGQKTEREYVFYVDKEYTNSYFAIAYIYESLNSNSPPESAILWKVED